MTDMEIKLRKALAIQRELDLRKVLFEELDKVVAELRAAGFTEAIVDDKIVKLQDNFADTNTQWRMAAIKRWELKVTKRQG